MLDGAVVTSRHTRQGLARGQRRGRSADGDPYDADEDYGSHEATNRREQAQGHDVSTLARRLNPAHPYGMIGAPLPCRLCQPDSPCSFHDGS